MEYKILVDKLSSKSGIDREIFNLDFRVISSKDSGLVLIEKNNKKGFYYSSYHHIANLDENWKAVALFIPNEIFPEFAEILNSIFEEEKEVLIDTKNLPEKFQYFSDDKSFNVVYGKKEGQFYRVDFALKNQ